MIPQLDRLVPARKRVVCKFEFFQMVENLKNPEYARKLIDSITRKPHELDYYDMIKGAPGVSGPEKPEGSPAPFLTNQQIARI